MKSAGMTGKMVAQVTGVTERTARKWVAPKMARNSSEVPWSDWILIAAKIYESTGKWWVGIE